MLLYSVISLCFGRGAFGLSQKHPKTPRIQVTSQTDGCWSYVGMIEDEEVPLLVLPFVLLLLLLKTKKTKKLFSELLVVFQKAHVSRLPVALFHGFSMIFRFFWQTFFFKTAFFALFTLVGIKHTGLLKWYFSMVFSMFSFELLVMFGHFVFSFF